MLNIDKNRAKKIGVRIAILIRLPCSNSVFIKWNKRISGILVL